MGDTAEAWEPSQLNAIATADELQIASRRDDGSLRRYITIWVVCVDEALFVRSAHGSDNPWYRRAVASGVGRIRAGGVEADVSVAPAADADQGAIDAAYHTKYDRYGPTIVGSVVGPSAAHVTLRLTPRS